MYAHLARSQHAFVINLIACLSIRRQSSSFVDVEMLEPGATDYHVLRRGEIESTLRRLAKLSNEG